MAGEKNSLDYDCDWRLGFNLDPRATGTMGYLLFWSGCGGLSLAKDIEVWNPFSGSGQTVTSGATIKCIGLIESFRFAGDEDAPIRIAAYVSKGTSANVRAKLSNPLTTTSVQVAWYILSYDDEAKLWFESAYVKDNARAQADIDVVGGATQLFIDSKPVKVDERLDLKVFKLEFQIVPAEGSSSILEFAAGPTQKLVKSWAQE
jgi:hypothetical protein